MKTLNLMSLALVAFGSFVGAQEPAPKEETRLNVSVFENKRWRTYPASGSNKDGILYDDHGTMKQRRLKSPYMVQSPKDLGEGFDLYYGGDLKAAVKKFAKVRKDYAGFRYVRGNPAIRATLCELDCAMRLQDWKRAETLAAAIERKVYGAATADEIRTAEAAKAVAGFLQIDAADKEKLAQACEQLSQSILQYAALESGKGKAAKINLRAYGWYCYGLARLTEEQIPAAEIQGGLSKENAAAASRAVDRYCQFVVCSHGGSPELEKDALLRAVHLLNAMPGVADFLNSSAALGKLDAKRWSNAPADFKEAVALAHLILTVYDTECQDEVVTRLAPRFFNAQKGAGDDAKAAKKD